MAAWSAGPLAVHILLFHRPTVVADLHSVN